MAQIQCEVDGRTFTYKGEVITLGELYVEFRDQKLGLMYIPWHRVYILIMDK